MENFEQARKETALPWGKNIDWARIVTLRESICGRSNLTKATRDCHSFCDLLQGYNTLHDTYPWHNAIIGYTVDVVRR